MLDTIQKYRPINLKGCVSPRDYYKKHQTPYILHRWIDVSLMEIKSFYIKYVTNFLDEFIYQLLLKYTDDEKN